MTTLRILLLACALVFTVANSRAAATLWNFSNSADRLAASSGPGVLDYYDPDNTGWGPAQTQFGNASSFGLPSMANGDPEVMHFPACGPRQGYRVIHGGSPNGPYGESASRVSNYTLIMDVLWPTAGDARWRALYQTDTNNASDAEFYVQNTPSGGVGTINVYNGSIPPNSWHRIAIVMQSAPGEGKCQRFIDGRFVGGIGSTGSGLDSRWSLAEALLLFADDDGETASGFISSVYFVDRAMKFEEVEALGGPNSAGATTPGPILASPMQKMTRRVGPIGHRGGFFCCAPDNTMAAVRRAITNRAPAIEIDTRLSADGVCVLMHDSTVDRTTDGTGSAGAMTVAQLKTLDAGSWFSPDFAGERVPTLAEVMAEAKGKLILYFDLKVPGQINAITNAIAQTGFNPDDCWFWVYNSSSDAASIRSRLPNAKIVWEAPGNWASDPNFFNSMRSIGVYGFDQGIYYGTINSSFVRAAKQEGFMVSIYTILDPDAMIRNAAVGVDFMETDFPQVMRQLQPPPAAEAALPGPANGEGKVSVNPTLTWAVGTNASSHKIYFGTNAAPDLYRQQSLDIVPLTNLLANTRYYWRVDEVTPTGVNTGQVWSFITGSAGPVANVYQWDFDEGSLAASIGNGVLAYSDSASEAATQFGTTDGSTIPHIDGAAAGFMLVPAFASVANGYDVSLTSTGPNGGGAYINQYTVIMDVLVPSPLNWTALFNTNPDNANDADWYVAGDGSVGIGDLGYSAAGKIAANTWARIAFAADLGVGRVDMYVNGSLARARTGASLVDGRYSLYSNVDPGPDLRLFNEGDAGGVYTHELMLNSLYIVDRTMSAAEIAALGGPNARGITPVLRLNATRTANSITLNWSADPNVRLQKTVSLSSPDWQDVAGTLGGGTYSELTTPGQAWFRLMEP